jgi:hypothetical protein
MTALAMGLCLAAMQAQAQTIAFGPDLSAQGWRALTFRSLAPVTFSASGALQLGVQAEKAASVIWRELDAESWARRQARWRWKVDSGPPATNLARKGGDDRALALYFVFARDEAAARAAKGATSLSSAMWWSSGAALVYVWGGTGGRDSLVPSPHMGASGKLILRQPGAIADGRWRTETAELEADFRRAFGREPGPLVGVAVSSDSDDTGSLTIAAIEGLALR